MREIEEQVERGTYLPKAKIPAFSGLAEDWLEYRKPNIRHSTFEQYRGHVVNHLNPYFGLTKVNKINFNAVEKFVSHQTARGVSPPTSKKVLVTLGGILKYAVRKKICESNPVREIEKPKSLKRKRVDFLNHLEIRALLDHITDQKLRTLVMLAIMSGARQGELFGLKWTDIDWFNCQMHIKRSYNHGRFYEPKSRSSFRAIDLGETTITELKRWKIACLPSELDLVFPNNAGKPMNTCSRFTRIFHTALRNAGLRKIRFHDLRHTYASLLIDQGEHPKYIQTQMGHSSINVTMDTYGHLMNPVNREASKRLDSAIFGENGDFLETFKEKGPNQNG
ncbi:MAG: site-specific integrase [Deltaproteobacteria bacterium]|nr:site-specific integrase [Deltaproteobacteria bacterium]